MPAQVYSCQWSNTTTSEVSLQGTAASEEIYRLLKNDGQLQSTDIPQYG
jgi:hypothetical protein